MRDPENSTGFERHVPFAVAESIRVDASRRRAMCNKAFEARF